MVNFGREVDLNVIKSSNDSLKSGEMNGKSDNLDREILNILEINI